MNIQVIEKPKQTPLSISVQQRHETGVYRVVEANCRQVRKEDEFQVGGRILILTSNYASCYINLRTEFLYTDAKFIADNWTIKIIRDFTVKSVSLFEDESVSPDYQ